MLRMLIRGLLGRLLGYSAVTLGFWLLFKGFVGPSITLAVLGGAVILVGMYLLVTARRGVAAAPTIHFKGSEEDNPRDSLDRGNESD